MSVNIPTVYIYILYFMECLGMPPGKKTTRFFNDQIWWENPWIYPWFRNGMVCLELGQLLLHLAPCKGDEQEFVGGLEVE